MADLMQAAALASVVGIAAAYISTKEGEHALLNQSPVLLFLTPLDCSIMGLGMAPLIANFFGGNYYDRFLNYTSAFFASVACSSLVQFILHERASGIIYLPWLVLMLFLLVSLKLVKCLYNWLVGLIISFWVTLPPLHYLRGDPELLAARFGGSENPSDELRDQVVEMV